MGDGADFALDAMEDDALMLLDTNLSPSDFFERGLYNEFGGLIGSEKRKVTCRCCKQSGLLWKNHHGKWRLFDKKGLHQCPVNPLCPSVEVDHDR